MNAKQILEQLDSLEVVAIELLSKIVAWVAPLVTAILIIMSLTTEPLNYHWTIATMYGFTIEALGIAFVSTMVFFFSEWWGRLPAVGAFAVAAVCVVGYAVIAFPVVTVIKGYPEFAWVVPAGGVLLSLLSGVIVGVRANWTKYNVTHGVTVTQESGQTRKNTGFVTNLDTVKGNDAKRQAAQERKQKAAELSRRGYEPSDIADELDVSERTVKRYLRDVDATTTPARPDKPTPTADTSERLIDALPMDTTGQDALRESVGHFTNGAGGEA